MPFFRELPPEQYAALRFKIICDTEGGGTVQLRPYLDSKGIPTIGLGMKLTDQVSYGAVVQHFLNPENIELSSKGKKREEEYKTQLLDIILKNSTQIPASSSIKDTMQADLDSIMATRAADPEINYSNKRKVFAFSDAEEVKQVFEQLTRTYENRINAKIANVPYSHERAVLFSLAYNNKALIGPNLIKALIDKNRAEAWYEIRYRSNGGQSRSLGIAKRRYYESQIFGLYYDTNSASDLEVQHTLQMTKNHEMEISQYDAQFGDQIKQATQDYDTFIQSFTESLEPITQYELLKVDVPNDASTNNVNIPTCWNASCQIPLDDFFSLCVAEAAYLKEEEILPTLQARTGLTDLILVAATPISNPCREIAVASPSLKQVSCGFRGTANVYNLLDDLRLIPSYILHDYLKINTSIMDVDYNTFTVVISGRAFLNDLIHKKMPQLQCEDFSYEITTAGHSYGTYASRVLSAEFGFKGYHLEAPAFTPSQMDRLKKEAGFNPSNSKTYQGPKNLINNWCDAGHCGDFYEIEMHPDLIRPEHAYILLQYIDVENRRIYFDPKTALKLGFVHGSSNLLDSCLMGSPVTQARHAIMNVSPAYYPQNDWESTQNYLDFIIRSHYEGKAIAPSQLKVLNPKMLQATLPILPPLVKLPNRNGAEIFPAKTAKPAPLPTALNLLHPQLFSTQPKSVNVPPSTRVELSIKVDHVPTVFGNNVDTLPVMPVEESNETEDQMGHNPQTFGDTEEPRVTGEATGGLRANIFGQLCIGGEVTRNTQTETYNRQISFSGDTNGRETTAGIQITQTKESGSVKGIKGGLKVFKTAQGIGAVAGGAVMFNEASLAAGITNQGAAFISSSLALSSTAVMGVLGGITAAAFITALSLKHMHAKREHHQLPHLDYELQENKELAMDMYNLKKRSLSKNELNKFNKNWKKSWQSAKTLEQRAVLGLIKYVVENPKSEVKKDLAAAYGTDSYQTLDHEKFLTLFEHEFKPLNKACELGDVKCAYDICNQLLQKYGNLPDLINLEKELLEHIQFDEKVQLLKNACEQGDATGAHQICTDLLKKYTDHAALIECEKNLSEHIARELQKNCMYATLKEFDNKIKEIHQKINEAPQDMKKKASSDFYPALSAIYKEQFQTIRAGFEYDGDNALLLCEYLRLSILTEDRAEARGLIDKHLPKFLSAPYDTQTLEQRQAFGFMKNSIYALGSYGDVAQREYAVEQLQSMMKFEQTANIALKEQAVTNVYLGSLMLKDSYFDYKKAEAYYKAAVELDPTNSEAAVGYAYVLCQQKQRAQADKVLLECGVHNNNPELLRAQRDMIKEKIIDQKEQEAALIALDEENANKHKSLKHGREQIQVQQMEEVIFFGKLGLDMLTYFARTVAEKYKDTEGLINEFIAYVAEKIEDVSMAASCLLGNARQLFLGKSYLSFILAAANGVSGVGQIVARRIDSFVKKYPDIAKLLDWSPCVLEGLQGLSMLFDAATAAPPAPVWDAELGAFVDAPISNVERAMNGAMLAAIPLGWAHRHVFEHWRKEGKAPTTFLGMLAEDICWVAGNQVSSQVMNLYAYSGVIQNTAGYLGNAMINLPGQIEYVGKFIIDYAPGIMHEGLRTAGEYGNPIVVFIAELPPYIDAVLVGAKAKGAETLTAAGAYASGAKAYFLGMSMAGQVVFVSGVVAVTAVAAHQYYWWRWYRSEFHNSKTTLAKVGTDYKNAKEHFETAKQKAKEILKYYPKDAGATTLLKNIEATENAIKVAQEQIGEKDLSSVFSILSTLDGEARLVSGQAVLAMYADEIEAVRVHIEALENDEFMSHSDKSNAVFGALEELPLLYEYQYKLCEELKENVPEPEQKIFTKNQKTLAKEIVKMELNLLMQKNNVLRLNNAKHYMKKLETTTLQDKELAVFSSRIAIFEEVNKEITQQDVEVIKTNLRKLGVGRARIVYAAISNADKAKVVQLEEILVCYNEQEKTYKIYFNQKGNCVFYTIPTGEAMELLKACTDKKETEITVKQLKDALNEIITSFEDVTSFSEDRLSMINALNNHFMGKRNALIEQLALIKTDDSKNPKEKILANKALYDELLVIDAKEYDILKQESEYHASNDSLFIRRLQLGTSVKDTKNVAEVIQKRLDIANIRSLTTEVIDEIKATFFRLAKELDGADGNFMMEKLISIANVHDQSGAQKANTQYFLAVFSAKNTYIDRVNALNYAKEAHKLNLLDHEIAIFCADEYCQEANHNSALETIEQTICETKTFLEKMVKTAETKEKERALDKNIQQLENHKERIFERQHAFRMFYGNQILKGLIRLACWIRDSSYSNDSQRTRAMYVIRNLSSTGKLVAFMEQVSQHLKLGESIQASIEFKKEMEYASKFSFFSKLTPFEMSHAQLIYATASIGVDAMSLVGYNTTPFENFMFCFEALQMQLSTASTFNTLYNSVTYAVNLTSAEQAVIGLETARLLTIPANFAKTHWVDKNRQAGKAPTSLVEIVMEDIVYLLSHEWLSNVLNIYTNAGVLREGLGFVVSKFSSGMREFLESAISQIHYSGNNISSLILKNGTALLQHLSNTGSVEKILLATSMGGLMGIAFWQYWSTRWHNNILNNIKVHLMLFIQQPNDREQHLNWMINQLNELLKMYPKSAILIKLQNIIYAIRPGIIFEKVMQDLDACLADDPDNSGQITLLKIQFILERVSTCVISAEEKEKLGRLGMDTARQLFFIHPSYREAAKNYEENFKKVLDENYIPQKIEQEKEKANDYSALRNVIFAIGGGMMVFSQPVGASLFLGTMCFQIDYATHLKKIHEQSLARLVSKVGSLGEAASKVIQPGEMKQISSMQPK